MTIEDVLGLYNYWIVIFLMMTGFYIVIARGNLIKTIIGLNIFQTSVFLLYITMGKVHGGTAPIIQGGSGDHGHGDHGSDDHKHEAIEQGMEQGAETIKHGTDHGSVMVDHAVEPASFITDVAADVGEVAASGAGPEYAGVLYSNPLPSVLMLTAIVVGIATTALALALVVRIREEYGTIEDCLLYTSDAADE